MTAVLCFVSSGVLTGLTLFGLGWVAGQSYEASSGLLAAYECGWLDGFDEGQDASHWEQEE